MEIRNFGFFGRINVFIRFLLAKCNCYIDAYVSVRRIGQGPRNWGPERFCNSKYLKQLKWACVVMPTRTNIIS